MIPIGESFLFIEPIYLQAESSRIPELKRVVVANGNNIAMERTFQNSLDVVFGRRASSLPGADGSAVIPTAVTEDDRDKQGSSNTSTTTVQSDDIDVLLREAQNAAAGAQQELDKLRSILDQIEGSQGE